MKIYTKKGDQGETSLFGGDRVQKNHPRIQAYGTIDTLNAHIGLIRDLTDNLSILNQLVQIQTYLFTIGSHLATPENKKSEYLPALDPQETLFLEEWIDGFEAELDPLKSFILPGGHTLVSHTHIARCICRNAERLVVEVKQSDMVDQNILDYLNRLSDYLFVLSRYFAKLVGAKEVKWEPRSNP